MAAVRDVPDMARKKMTVSSRHPLFLESHFRPQKAASKRSKDVFYAMFTRKINNFPWSDPAQRVTFGHDSYPKASQDQFQIDIDLGTTSNMASNRRFFSLSLGYGRARRFGGNPTGWR
jgi:hypothetical protein